MTWHNLQLFCSIRTFTSVYGLFSNWSRAYRPPAMGWEETKFGNQCLHNSSHSFSAYSCSHLNSSDFFFVFKSFTTQFYTKTETAKYFPQSVGCVDIEDTQATDKRSEFLVFNLDFWYKRRRENQGREKNRTITYALRRLSWNVNTQIIARLVASIDVEWSSRTGIMTTAKSKANVMFYPGTVVVDIIRIACILCDHS